MKQHNDCRCYLTRDSEVDFTALAAELVAGASLESLASLMSLDETRWLYEEATGVLTNKVYADGKGPSYTYTPDGKLATRTWARGIATAYAYNAAGQLTGVDYSDTTPDVAYTYDRLGRQKVAQTFLSAHHYAYDPATLAMVSETIIDLQAGTSNVISRATDALGRSTGLSVAGVGDPGQPYSVTYGYDAYGRFAQVSNFQFQVSYSYLPGASLVSGMTASTGHAWSRSFEPARSLITAVENRFGETVISRFDYVNDAIGRRVSRVDSGQAFQNPAFDVYAYNTRSEVIGAQRYHGTDVTDTSKVYGGRGFGYAFDPIGNRTSATETVGGETLTKTYVANELNQYTSIANPAAVGLRGSATNTATVTVNGNATSRDSVVSTWTPWHHALPTDNANGGAYTFANIMAVVNPPGTNTPDIVESTSGSVYAPPQAEVLAYDDDGNLLSDGRWEYTWNGENRLVKAEELISPANREPHVVEYAYDHRGRMIWKTVASPNAPPSKTMRYLWDDFNIIAETMVADSATNTTYNVWGLDIDGTLQGAGGVGGLLAVIKDSAIYIPAWDANGNIMEYVAENGTIVAHREYDPFGGTVVYTWQSAINNPQSAISFTHWFSTKPWCTATGLSEYQYRKYSPALGRWLSRDPIEEEGGENLYIFGVNNSCSYIDMLGWMSFKDIAFSSIGWDKSGNIPRDMQGFPVGLGGARVQIIWYFTGGYFGCCNNGKKEHWFQASFGIEAYVIWGYAGKTPGWKGKGRDRNKRGPDGRKNKNRGPENRPIGAFRERSWHADFSGVDPCPSHTVTGSVYIFIRGSAGAYFGGQASVTRTWTFNDGVSGSDLDLSLHAAKGIVGVSIEVGGGGNISIKAPVPGVN